MGVGTLECCVNVDVFNVQFASVALPTHVAGMVHFRNVPEGAAARTLPQAEECERVASVV